MPVKISNISVRSLGPIDKLQETLQNVNLIFSPNEKGKTYLTEFMIRSLFRNLKRWNYMRKDGKGHITVNGISDEEIRFSPTSTKKLEDYLDENNKGLPDSIASLLAAKGAQASISQNGINRYILKDVLSGMNMLDQIENKISKTVQSAELNNGTINISKKGEGKQYKDKKEELERLDNLFREIETNYSRGMVEDYKQKITRHETMISRLQEAKKHKAFIISQQIKDTEEELAKYPEEELNALEHDIRSFEDTSADYTKKENQYETTLEKARNAEWLEKAKDQYKELLNDNSVKINPLFYAITGIGALGTIILLLLNLKLLSLAAFMLTFFGAFAIFRQLFFQVKNSGKEQELERLRSEFQQKTDRELTDIAVLEEELEFRRQQADRAEFIRSELEEISDKINEIENHVNYRFDMLPGEIPGKAQWRNYLKELKNKQKETLKKLNHEKELLTELGVSPSDYRYDDPGIPYSEEQLSTYQSGLEELKEKLKQQEDTLNNIKQRICDVTGDNFSVPLETLFNNLHNKREEVREELKKISAEIIAGIIVHNEVETVRKEEDEKIQQGLSSTYVTQPLFDITKRYKSLSLDNEQNLLVSDDYEDFLLQDLSTGAREQIMLALRIGFCNKLLKQDSMFLILDDAFQHSDWEKRELLVNKLAEISKMGWQIIYLTMDNHIYDLFQEVGDRPEIDFKSIEL
jgi:hypothetical protein